MQKRLLIWLLPVLFGCLKVDSTEIPFKLPAQSAYQLTKKVYNQDFQTIPQNPNVFKEESVYADQELTQISGSIQPNQPFSIVDATVNARQELVFQLSTGAYIAADTTLLFDDTILQEVAVGINFWLNKDAVLLSSPIGNQSTVLQSDLKAYQPVFVDKIVETPLGQFASIPDKGWVSLDSLSETDNRMEAVQELLNSKYAKETLGIFVKQVSTGETAGVNQDTPFYSASIAKLPILYYVQDQLNNQSIQLDTKLKYSKETMQFPGAYKVEGSGSLPKIADNKDYTVEELIRKTAKESDNVASNLLSYYVANRFDANYNQLITGLTDSEWNMVTRETSAKVAGLVMEEIYLQNGFILESMKETQFDNQRIPKDIPVPVAHKIGDADDVRHDVAVVYTDSPFILSIFTTKSSYDEISAIAKDIYGILK